MSNPLLPKGYFPSDWTDWDGYWVEPTGYNNEDSKNRLTKSCTCGTNKTAGEDLPKELHSQWCDLHDNSENSKK